jgi:hypothetical protein
VRGDANYGRIGGGYAQYRRPDPRIAATIEQAVACAETVLNVGAGAGSYESVDRSVTAVEPSASMRAGFAAWPSGRGARAELRDFIATPLPKTSLHKILCTG